MFLTNKYLKLRNLTHFGKLTFWLAFCLILRHFSHYKLQNYIQIYRLFSIHSIIILITVKNRNKILIVNRTQLFWFLTYDNWQWQLIFCLTLIFVRLSNRQNHVSFCLKHFNNNAVQAFNSSCFIDRSNYKILNCIIVC